MTKVNPRWSSTMMRRSSQEAQQVRCLTGDQGSEWIHGNDELPPPVRRRLAESVYNICPTCVWTWRPAPRRQRAACGGPPSPVYFDVIEAIERKLEQPVRGPGGDAMIDMLLLLIVVGVLMVAVVVDLAAVLGWLRRLRSDRACQRDARGVKEVRSRRRDGATGRNVE